MRDDTKPYVSGAKYPAGVGRERVHALTAKGLSPREVARVMDVSVQSVHYHLKQLEKERTASS